jgi:hypothetical protein
MYALYRYVVPLTSWILCSTTASFAVPLLGAEYKISNISRLCNNANTGVRVTSLCAAHGPQGRHCSLVLSVIAGAC